MRINYAFCLFVFLVFTSCEPDQQAGDKIEIGVREEVSLQLRQPLSPQGSSLAFEFKSIGEVLCEEAGYNHAINRTNSRIDIHIINLHYPGPCNGGNSIATQQIPVTAQKGMFDISLDLGELIHNNGSLIVDDKSFTLLLASRFGIQLTNSIMHRIPAKTIWGYVYHPQLQAQAIDIFLYLMEPDSDPVALDEGYYDHFTVNNNTPEFPLPQEAKNAERFLLKYNGDPAKLASLLDQIKTQLPPGSECRLFTWAGEIFS